MSQIGDGKSAPKHWRSLAERAGNAAFRSRVAREIEEPPVAGADPPTAPERRRFLQLMGASMALAGAASGCRWERDELLPFSRRPEGFVPGVPKLFRTVMDLGGTGYAVTAKSYDGRPIKIEGNPKAPHSLGAANVFAQASVLEVYDPDRSRAVVQRSGGAHRESSWGEFGATARKLFAATKTGAGQKLRVLSEASSSPALAAMKKQLLDRLPQARWVEWEAVSRDNERAGTALVFGAPRRVHLSLERADTVLSLDCDLFARHPAAIKHARDFVSRRSPEAGSMSRLYAAESEVTSSGAMADHRLPIRSAQVKALAAALDAAVSAQVRAEGTPQESPKAAFLATEKVSKFLAAVTRDLLGSRGKSAIVAGSRQPPEVHAIAHRLNVLLGNVGHTVSYTLEPDPERPSHVEGIGSLVADMKAGKVETILVLGGNPVFDAPADLDFAAAYGTVPNRIHLSGYENETSLVSTWHLPRAHFLETWGDARSWDGTLSIAQPILEPIHGGRSPLEVLALLLGDEKKNGLEILRGIHRGWAPESDDRAWRRALHDGVVAGTRWGAAPPRLRNIPPIEIGPEVSPSEIENGSLELVLVPDSRVYDGRFANNGWLQELPDRMTKLTWDNAALLSPKTAEALGVEDSTLVKLSIGGRELKVPAMMLPGVAAGTVVLAYGNGRTAAGRVGGSGELGVPTAGTDVFGLRTTKLLHFGSGLTVTPTGEKYVLATTQDKHAIDQLGAEETQHRLGRLVREQTLAEYTKEPDAAKHAVHHPPLLSLWQEPVPYDGRRWGMSVDLNKCVGCNACLTACQAENNVPVVGKEKVAHGKEMHWIRVDRYFKGDPEDPEVLQQVVTCQQCEHAPCEQVCPVGATTHTHEGLNDMVYNRCIGTRYCSNNCPYKVRRFNYHNYHSSTGFLGRDNPMKQKDNQLRALVFNPEVTVRFRGVMEKCTFCVQRIEAVKIQANNVRRKIRDGEIQTACEQTCPSGAIVFGDLADTGSRVRELQNRPRSYALLEELNVRPRLRYLAKVRNPSPALAGTEPHGGKDH